MPSTTMKEQTLAKAAKGKALYNVFCGARLFQNVEISYEGEIALLKSKFGTRRVNKAQITKKVKL